MRVMLLLMTLAASGCTSMQRDTAFHLLNGIDAAQTSQFQAHHCIQEVMPITREVLGANPGAEETLLFFAGVSGLYQWMAGRYEDHRWWPIVSNLLIVGKAATMVRNQQFLSRGC